MQVAVFILTHKKANIEAMYPLTSLMSLTTFNRLIYLQPSGLISDSAQLDLLFTLPVDAPVLGISATDHKNDEGTSILVLQPSSKAYDELTSTFPLENYSDVEFMQGIQAMTDFAEDRVHLVAKTSALRLVEESFDAQEYLEATAYIHLSDTELPGPEYHLPESMLSMARPARPEPRKAWERTYEVFMERRMDICGLDLEPMKSDPTQTVTSEG